MQLIEEITKGNVHARIEVGKSMRREGISEQGGKYDNVKEVVKLWRSPKKAERVTGLSEDITGNG